MNEVAEQTQWEYSDMNDLPQEPQGETPVSPLVAAALVAAQAEMQAVAFDSQNPFLHNKYASLGACIAEARPVLAKHKLAILQVPSTNNDHILLTTRIVHASGQAIDCGTLSMLIGEEKGKSRAQVAGSLITYLRRYAWSSVLGLYAEEDTDGNAPPTKPTDKPAPSTKEPSNVAALRMRALNLLKAAPGQEHRPLVEAFLLHRGWIEKGQQCEAWQEAHVPKNKQEMEQVAAEVAQFDIDRHQSSEVVK